jgi:hypothetical protein
MPSNISFKKTALGASFSTADSIKIKHPSSEDIVNPFEEGSSDDVYTHFQHFRQRLAG